MKGSKHAINQERSRYLNQRWFKRESLLKSMLTASLKSGISFCAYSGYSFRKNHQRTKITMCRIVNAEYAGDYKVLITFSDGQKRLADFYDFMAQSEHPSINKYLDKDLFVTFGFNDFDIHWGSQFDIDPYDIYHGVFEALDSPYLADVEAVRMV